MLFYSHKTLQNDFVFPVRDVHLRFISSNLFFSVPIGRIYPILVKTLQRVRDFSYSKFSGAEIFFGELLAIKISIY